VEDKTSTPEADSGINPGMKHAPKTEPGTAVAPSSEPTPEEQAALAPLLEKLRKKPRIPSISLTKEDGALKIALGNADDRTGHLLLMKALGTADCDFVNGLLSQAVNAGTRGTSTDASGANFILAVVKSVAPQDEIEAMLATQMAAVHMASMTFARRLAGVENIPQQDSASNAFNKLSRTFSAQMEALKRYRTGGEQRVTVRHVSVHQGGQAIVGSVSAAKGGGGG